MIRWGSFPVDAMMLLRCQCGGVAAAVAVAFAGPSPKMLADDDELTSFTEVSCGVGETNSSLWC